MTQSVGSFHFDPEGNIGARPLKPDVQRIFLRAGDRLLLCSDGIPDCLGEGYEAVVVKELAADAPPEAIARRLCELADEAMGGDNMTALVILTT